MSFVSVSVGGGALLGGALAGGGSLLSGTLGYFGAKSASEKQAEGAQNALNFQKQVYADNQPRFAAASSAFNNAQGIADNSYRTSSAAFQPWLTTGQNANYTLSQLTGTGTNNKPDYSSFFNSPDYQFAQSQGQRGAINAANAQGVGLSGGTLKDLSEFNSGLASQQYGNYFSRLMSLSQMGQGAAGGLAGAANNYANTSSNIAGGIGNLATGAANSNNAAGANIGNTYQGIGQAQASGIVGGTNAITGAINNGVSNSLLYNSLNRSSPTGTAYGSGGGLAGGSAFNSSNMNSNYYGPLN